MRLEWKSLFLNQDKKIEFLVDTFVFIIIDKKLQHIKFGRVQNIDWPESIEVQTQFLLAEFKKAGSLKADLEVSVICKKSQCVYGKKFYEEIIRFGLSCKTQHLEDRLESKILISLQDGSVWLSKYKNNKKKVLIVEDSKPVQKILQKVFSEIPNLDVIGIAEDPQTATELFNKLNPDFISLDMNLKGGSGVDFLGSIKLGKSRCVLVTDCAYAEGNLVFEALEKGASSYIQKPKAADLQEFAKNLEEMIKAFFEDTRLGVIEDFKTEKKGKINHKKYFDINKFDLIAIGSSTGGTEVVRDLIAGFPESCPPIVVVQHMPETFTGLYAERLSKQTGKSTIEVREMIELKKGHAYIAAGGLHLTVEKRNGILYGKPKDGELVNRFKPSVSILFESIHKIDLAKKTIALILTGMGNDGAKELLDLKNAGAMTIGQSRESCTVYGMPRAAEELGALIWSASPIDIIESVNPAGHYYKKSI